LRFEGLLLGSFWWTQPASLCALSGQVSIRFRSKPGRNRDCWRGAALLTSRRYGDALGVALPLVVDPLSLNTKLAVVNGEQRREFGAYSGLGVDLDLADRRAGSDPRCLNTAFKRHVKQPEDRAVAEGQAGDIWVSETEPQPHESADTRGRRCSSLPPRSLP